MGGRVDIEICEMFSVRRFVSVQVFVDIVLWLSVFLPASYLFLRGTPVEQGFFCDDESLSHPYKPDTVTNHALIVVGFGISVFIVVLVETLNCIDKQCLPYLHISHDLLYCVKGYAAFLVGFIVQELVVEIVKNQMGYLRPNFFDVCRPQFNRSHCPGYITKYTCTGSEDRENDLRDIRQSFPSGHSSFSMYTAVYFSLYIQRRLHIKFSLILKFLMQSGLLIVSLWCGLSRISDHKHHPRDVIVGFLLGAIVAIAVSKTIGRDFLTEDYTDVRTHFSKLDPEKTEKKYCVCNSPTSNYKSLRMPLLQNEYVDSTCSDTLVGILNEQQLMDPVFNSVCPETSMTQLQKLNGVV